ncbi:MAG: aldo/keto reductase [Candidatus Cybelea sp.]|jgi:aryl-alcohol dehydrogenase-like predicted oxidoreductase
MNRSSTITIGNELTVRRLGFGGMRLCGPGIWGWPADRENALRVLRRALELGVNFIDTADSYGPHVNEEQIAQALHPYPSGLVIATKGGLTRGGPGDWKRDCRPEHLREACDGSLRRLRVDRIDVYQLHAIDTEVPFEDQIGAMRELREAGKVRHVGLSNVDLEQLKRAQKIVEIVSVQNNYNVGNRTSEPVLKYCEANGIAFVPYFPLDGGDLAANQALSSVAGRRNMPVWQIGLAWLLRHSPAMLPIPGTSSVAHLEENVGATGLALDDEEYRQLCSLGGEEE